MGRRNKVDIVVKKSATTGKENRHQTRSITKALSKKGKSKALGKSKSTSLLPSSNISKQKPKETSSTVEFPNSNSNTPIDRTDICFLCNFLCEEDSAKASIECSNCGVWLHGSCLDLNDNDLCILNKFNLCVFCRIKGIREVNTLLEIQHSTRKQINSSLSYPSLNSQHQSISPNPIDNQLPSNSYSGRVRGLVNPRSSFSPHNSSSFLANGQQGVACKTAPNNNCTEDLCTHCGRLFKGPKEEHLTVCKSYCSQNQSSFLANGQQTPFSNQSSLNKFPSEDLCTNCGKLFKGSKEAHLLVCNPRSSSPSIQGNSLLEERDISDSNTIEHSDNPKNSDTGEILHNSANQDTPASTTHQISSHHQHHIIGQRTKFIVLIDNFTNPWLFRNSTAIKREFTKHFPNIQVKLAFSQRAGGISIQFTSEKDLQKVLDYNWPPTAFCDSGKDLICRRLRNLHKIVLKNVDPRKTESEIEDILCTFTGFDFRVHRFRYQDTGRAIPVVSLSSRSQEAINCIRTGRLSISGCQVKVEEHIYYFPEEVKCFRCHESGHVARLCPGY